MAIFNTGYDTTLGRTLVMATCTRAIRQALIEDEELATVSLSLIPSSELRPVFITGRSSAEDKIPLFYHPLLVEGLRRERYLCTDLRPFLKQAPDDLTQIQAVAQNPAFYQFAFDRTALTLLSLQGRSSVLKAQLSLAGRVYARWISEALRSSFLLDASDQLQLEILSFIFYQMLFYPDGHPFEESLELFAAQAQKALAGEITMTYITQLLTPKEPGALSQTLKLNTITDFCHAIKTTTANVRLENLTPKALIEAISRSWYFPHADEVLGMALEHPPTWCAVVKASLTHRNWAKSKIANIAEMAGRIRGGRQTTDEFLRQYRSLIQELTVEAPNLTFRSF